MKDKTVYIILGAIILGVAGFVIAANYRRSPQPDSSLVQIHRSSSPSPTAVRGTLPPATVKPSPSSTPTPASPSAGKKVLDVPFTSQAPTGVWDSLHEEMCEEGTIVMAHAWVNGLALSPSYAEKEIQKLAKWETANFGTYIDTSARETAQMGQAVYGLHTKIIDRPSVAQIKAEIDADHVVIMGMAGRMLHNPNYTPPGPLYHMMLIKGYDATGFITNDDGTRNGNSYHYAYATLMAAAHDWNGNAASLTSNPAVAIVVSK